MVVVKCSNLVAGVVMVKCSYLVALCFLSAVHCGQYHLPLGLDVRPTHWKWNHSMGHCMRGERNNCMGHRTRGERNNCMGHHIQEGKETSIGHCV